MAETSSLKDIYVDELRDLWSANDQMVAALKEISPKVSDEKLKQTLSTSVEGIGKHTAMLKSVLEANGGETSKEHCRGMEGLVREAKKHALEERPENGTLADLMVIAQYQRMSHYGLAGFGTASAYARALGRTDDEKTLNQIVEDIYQADELGSRVAERLEQAVSGKG